MQTITLGKTGISVCELGFGAMYLPRVSAEESDVLLQRALDLGIDYFDTASAYQDSEEKLGRVLSVTGKPFTITSRSIAYKMGVEAFIKDFEQSLSRLRLDGVDFYGFHAVNQPPELEKAMGEPLQFLKEQQARGRIRHLAITGHNPKTLADALGTGEFELAMFPFNVIETEPLDGLLDTAAAMGVATCVMKPLAGGVIEDKEAALRFFFSHPAGIVTPGMKSIEELEHNVEVFQKRRPLSAGELRGLQEGVAALGQDFCRRCSYCMPCKNGIMIPFVHMIHMKCYDKPMDDEVAYTLGLAKMMQAALEKCDQCGTCVEKCPYDIPTPQRVRQLREMLQKEADKQNS